jgi:hypothetical protein
MGQILKNCKIYAGPIYIDPRVSLFIVQPSATGKSTPWGFIFDVGRAGGLAVDDIDEATDASLVGTVEEVETLDEQSGTKVRQYNKVYGKLANAELLHYDEGSFLLERGAYAQHTMTWFQKALNPIGSEQSKVTKRMAHGVIEFYPTCSLIITSHPVENMLSSVINKGFFQRIILYPRDIAIEERQALEFLRADKLGNRVFTEPDIKELGEALQKTRAKYDKTEVKFDENTKPVIKAKIKSFYDLIKPAHPKVKEIMATFIPRFNNFMYTFAFHKCCDRLGDKVEISDINYAHNLCYILFTELMKWVEETADFYKLGSKDYSYYRLALFLFQKMQPDLPSGYVLQHRFMNACAEQWKVSMPTVLKYLEKFRGFGKLKEHSIGNVKYIKVE